MPLQGQSDVANSGLRPGQPLINGSITCAVMPNGIQLGKKYEKSPFPLAIEPSGLNARYTSRFTHSIALT